MRTMSPTSRASTPRSTMCAAETSGSRSIALAARPTVSTMSRLIARWVSPSSGRPRASEELDERGVVVGGDDGELPALVGDLRERPQLGRGQAVVGVST